MLTHSKIGTQIAFCRDMRSKIQICLFIPPMTQEPSPCLCLNQISIWWSAGEAIGRGESLQVQQALHSEWVMNWALRRAQDWRYSCWTAASQNQAKFDYVLVDKSLAEFAILQGQCQDTPYALQMLSVQVGLHHHPFVVPPLLVPLNRLWHTSYLCYGSGKLRPPIQVVSIHQVSSASAETSLCANVLFWGLCPVPSRVRHLRSACPALTLHHPHPPHPPHPPHHRNMQDHSDCLW